MTTLAERLTAEDPVQRNGTTIYHLGRLGARLRGGPGLLWAAAILLLALAAAQGYVSWRAQYAFIYQAKHASLPATLEALGLDTGAVIFALLGLAQARMGRSATIERALNLACAFGSMTMNLLGADLGSPRSVAVYVLPAVLYAACSDRLIATAGHMAGVRETSLWRTLGITVLYLLRACVALPSTASGMRRRLLELTPLPEPPTLTAITAPLPASPRAQLHALWSIRADRHTAPAAALARDLGPLAGMAEGSARNAITAFRKDQS